MSASAFTPAERPLSRAIAAQAAEWFVLLHSGEATAAERQAFDGWLARAPEHARAWQRALQVSQRANSVPPALGAPALQRPRNRRTAVRALLLLMTAAPAGWLAWRHVPPQWTATHATATGEQRELQLPDGTRLRLDTASAIDLAYDGTQRLVLLRAGAVLVETARDPAGRPFRVRTAEGMARAIGTRFVVRQAAGHSHVAVLQGAVEIAPHEGGTPRVLQAQQQADFDRVQVEAAAPLEAGAGQWARGILAVDDMRLDAFIAEVARYRPGLLRCEPAVAGLRITGAFQLADTDAILQNVAQLLPVEVRFRTRYWVTVTAPEPRR